MKKTTRYKTAIKKKIEFSKIVLASLLVLTILCTITSYIFVWFGRDGLIEITRDLLKYLYSMDGLACIGYNVQNIFRAKYFDKPINNETQTNTNDYDNR